MTMKKGRAKRGGPELRPDPARVSTTRPAAPGPRDPAELSAVVGLLLNGRETCARLLRWKKAEADSRIRRRRAHTDDMMRVIRFLVVAIVFFSAVSVLIAYAGIRMGVPPEICWFGTMTGAPMLVRTFIKLFETVRPSLPDAPRDPPPNDVP
ncbi:hypothetical protein [Streptomyces spectabilis]|uniref:Uncharacterized protein n=1 Tax=Streptomyces spectabilis TaxID=68270 RepID=A0A5P2XE34_STRST|nr:hypothetical protein [Streptomyces spectabilis]MBB5106599.1 hypothetical protein [Streptomyces spectabilis]MCI3903544.1 hypothetical protein [Streptomyces spectabilis]QEV60742.1 hypothetical protein CP982_20110 [Streptomyces spectabilis]GGV48254.1 hypothetical protein GCM10010245_75930 [Streptomyces spectabilis]